MMIRLFDHNCKSRLRQLLTCFYQLIVIFSLYEKLDMGVLLYIMCNLTMSMSKTLNYELQKKNVSSFVFFMIIWETL